MVSTFKLLKYTRICNEESVRDNFLCDGGGNSLYSAVSILCKCYVNYTILYMAFGRVILTYICMRGYFIRHMLNPPDVGFLAIGPNPKKNLLYCTPRTGGRYITLNIRPACK
jgi:hypothetical protein